MPLQSHIPPCLNWPTDDKARSSQAKLLPRLLFGQLRAALQPLEAGDEDSCPSPASLLDLWEERPVLALDRCEVTQSMVADWLDAYWYAWQQEMISMAGSLEEVQSYERRVPPSSYVQSCSALLSTRRAPLRHTVPIAVINGKSSGRVQWLHIDVCPYQGGECLLHPEAEFTRQYFELSFIEGLQTAWQLAEPCDEELSAPRERDSWTNQSGSLKKITIFWHITETDGRQVIDDYRQGTSASAAAFRAFWHVRRGLEIDPEVYVLGSCADGDGSVQDVGGLAQKVATIREHRQTFGIQTPATLVMSSNGVGRTSHDNTAIAQAESWAVVHQVATCAELTAVRSCECTAAIAYLNHLAETLDQCRLLPMGRRLSEVPVPPQVWKDERIRPEHEAGWRDESENEDSSDTEQRDAPPKKRRVRQPWERVFHLHRGRSPLVLVGGPGSGKSTVLHWTAREMALESVAALQARSCQPAEISWPVLVNLDTWAAHEQRQQPRASLISLITGAVPEEMPPHERSAITRLIEQRFTTATQQTCLLLDSLDQVASGRAVLLTKRLAALNELTSRLVLTTRESGLRSHDEAMKTLPSPTLVESAPLTPEDTRTLAAKWLGPEQAARLERHLRSHPSLGIVADSPLLLTLACLVASEQPDQTPPETPSALYQEMTGLLAQGRWRHGDDAPPASHDPQALLDQLPGIAWRLFVRSPGVNRFDRNTMLDAIERITGRKGEARAEFLDHQLVEFGFMEASEGSRTEPSYEFRHTTLLEFLAARHLASTIHLHTWNAASADAWQTGTGWQTANIGALIDAQAFEPSWEPIILFVAGLLKEPLPLIEMLADRGRDDLFRHRLGLLCRCCESIAAQKEAQLRDLLRSVLKQMAQIGHRAVRRRPERWKRWLENIGALLSLPQTSQEAVQLLVSLVTGRHEGRMHGNHDILELLVAKASSSNSVAPLDAMLRLCTEDIGHSCDKMATALVECAEKNCAHGHVEKLEALVNDLGAMPGQQVAISGGLLASRDSSVVDRAIGFLKTKAQDWEAEEWVRSSAANQLINLVGREQELTVATILIDKIFKSYSFGAGTTASHSFAYEVVSAVLHRPSEFGTALSLLIFRTHTHAANLLFRCCEVLAKSLSVKRCEEP